MQIRHSPVHARRSPAASTKLSRRAQLVAIRRCATLPRRRVDAAVRCEPIRYTVPRSKMSKTYTLCEIAQHNGKDGKPVWLIIKGVVYDVTDFVHEHPGGYDVVMEYAGKDATKGFNEVGHSADAIGVLKKYKIGVVAPECKQSSNMPITLVPEVGGKHSGDDAAECCRTQKKRLKIFFCF